MDAIQQAWKHWQSISYRADFKGYLKRMENISEGRVEGLTSAQRLVELARILNAFRNSGKFHEQIMEIKIQNWGTVKEFSACQQVPDNDLI